MEILWGIIIASAMVVTGIIEYIKELDKKDKLVKLYKWLPLPLSFSVAVINVFINNGFKFWPFMLTGFLIFSVATLGHDVIIRFVKTKITSMK